ncbi:MAG TPA: nuclear transport factor 2 family protein [Candidatus Marinimicrobia bacterium]|nr:nuclear transport factor 2 family protein [Candidatus Neomarinimicrobiota bacterium]
MKKILLIALLLIVGCDSSDKKSIEKLSEELKLVVLDVWNDANNRDIESLKSAHFNSPRFSKFGPRVSERQNVDETNSSESEHFSSIKDVDLKMDDLKIDIFDNVGVVTFYNNYSFIKNSKSVNGKGRVTLVFYNTHDGWKIVHEHSSSFN